MAFSDTQGGMVGELKEEAQATVRPEITLRVACMDGITLDVTVPQLGLVSDITRAVGQVRQRLFELHIITTCALTPLPMTRSRAT